MPKFVYTGTRRDNPRISDGNIADHVIMYGVTFPKGVVTEVTDPFAVRKLTGNLFFALVPDVAPDAPVALPAEAPEIGAALTPMEPAVDMAHPIEAQFAPNALLGEPKKKGRRK